LRDCGAALDRLVGVTLDVAEAGDPEIERECVRAFELTALAESYVPDGVEVDLSFSGDESSIPKLVKMQVYLAMREAGRNALRHTSCLRKGIALRVCDGEVYGLVEDDGEGFDPGAVGKVTRSWAWGCSR
jgi:signal transduction histidine kinase